MRVITRGAKPDQRWFTCTCYRCKTEFEFQQFEGKVTDDQRDGSFVSIDCPECGDRCHASLRLGVFRPERPSR